jgi:hypothetical protein
MNDNLLDPNSIQDDQIDPAKNYLQELVGEGKKFKTPEELARGKAESDAYIKTLERGRDELRQDYLKMREESVARAKLEDLIGQLESKQQQPTPPANTQNAGENIQPQWDSKQIESLVSSKIQEHELTRKQEQNFNTVRSKLQERYGNNYQAILKQQIDGLGLTEDFINTLARQHPTVLFKTLDLDSPARTENFQTPPRPGSPSTSFNPQGPKERTWSYYQELKKANPKAYYDPKTQVQMHHDAIELKEKFEDGDFKAL